MSGSTSPEELTEKLLRLVNLQADTALKEALARHQAANLQADTRLKDLQAQQYINEQIARINNLLIDTQKKQREYHLAPWQIGVTIFAGGVALFAAGAAFVKVFGG